MRRDWTSYLLCVIGIVAFNGMLGGLAGNHLDTVGLVALFVYCFCSGYVVSKLAGQRFLGWRR